jgi:hypothetical protein
MFWTSEADRLSSIATSIGFLPDENSDNAFVSGDLFFRSTPSSTLPSILRIIEPITVNDRCATDTS